LLPFINRVYVVLSRARTQVSLGTLAVVATVAYVTAYLLRFEFAVPANYVEIMLRTLPALLLFRLISAYVLRVSRGRWRYVGIRDITRLLLATLAGSACFFFYVRVLTESSVPLSVIALEANLTLMSMSGIWMTYRAMFERHRRLHAHGDEPVRRVLIIGAGEAGNAMAREMIRFPTGYWPIGFVDDDASKWGTRMQGRAVLGATYHLRTIAAETRAEALLVAVPSAAPHQLRRIISRCEDTGLPVKILPGIREVLAGDTMMRHVRDVRIEDLLGRDPIQLELPEIAADLTGKSVLITGAAGSIGSELARQVARYHPQTLILLDQAETDLFYLEQELLENLECATPVAVVADVTDAPALERIFRRYAPDRVFHAAAYKHVPMMEANPAEAVRNNVIGTLRVAEAAARYGCGGFVLVSTDKAVRPANVMGATKRVAELVVLELQQKYPRTKFCAVRFGNVLGSQGSVVPIFRRQIEEGKPLTVTHPEATRYFMTIPEAVQLILQASVLPEVRGQIAMLDMGEPVRIVELAENMLRLSGSVSAEEVSSRIVFTGLRPGEKLHEELAAPDEEEVATSIAKVHLVRHAATSSRRLISEVKRWDAAFQDGDDSGPIAALRALFPNVLDAGIYAEQAILDASSPAVALPTPG